MKLKFEEDLKVAVEIDGKPFITLEEGILYQHIGDDEAFFYIKNSEETKEIKIKIIKEDDVKQLN
jgi:hypothetical protein